MKPDMLQTSKQLVAHPDWEWRAGMRLSDGALVYLVRESGDVDVIRAYEPGLNGFTCSMRFAHKVLPDLTDNPTGGAILGMLGNEAWRVAYNGVNWLAFDQLDLDTPASPVICECLGEAAAVAWLAVRTHEYAQVVAERRRVLDLALKPEGHPDRVEGDRLLQDVANHAVRGVLGAPDETDD